jgi:peptidoglycan hydrolase-like protein with peptidoglycan-binding domain
VTWPRLMAGLTSPEVGNWQRFLTEEGVTDWNGKPLVVDESFGMRTTYATRQWQTKNNLTPTGEVDDVDRRTANLPLLQGTGTGFIPFIQAGHFNRIITPPRGIDVIVIHTMESSEKPGTAEAVARWFAGPNAPNASAHYCVDSSQPMGPLFPIVQCVRDADVAWHAPGVNHNGIGIEHAGRAAQTPADWSDAESQAILRASAVLAAKLAKRYNIPILKVAPDELKVGVRGFCGHVDATIAFPGPGRTHVDPGQGFVWQAYLDMVSLAFSKLP